MARKWVSSEYPGVRFRYYETHKDDAGLGRSFLVYRRPSQNSEDRAAAWLLSDPFPARTHATPWGSQSCGSAAPDSLFPSSDAVSSMARRFDGRDGRFFEAETIEKDDADSSSQEIKSFQLIPERSTITVVSCGRSVA